MSDAFDRLVAAARALSGTELLASEVAIPDDASEAFLTANRGAMDAAREALQGDCSVRLEHDNAFFQRYCAACSDLSKLGQSFCLGVAHAERRNDLALAVQHGVAALDVANALRRGGLVVGMLVAVVVEGMAIGRLRRVHRRLNSDRARYMAAELLRIDNRRESFDEVTARDVAWTGRMEWSDEPADFLTMEWPEDLRDGLDEEDEQFLRGAMHSIAELPEFERRELQRRLDNRELALLRLLALESALTAYYRDLAAHAPTLAHLVPGQLPTLPLDPFTGEAFRHFASDGECLVYSPGPTGVDRGGKFGCWFEVEAGSADLCLSMGDYPCGVGE